MVFACSHITAMPTPCCRCLPLPLPLTARPPLPHPPGNAIVYECIRTLTAIHPNPVLVGGAAESVARFLGARENNLRYAGIDALTRLVRIDPKYAQVRVRVGVHVRVHVCVPVLIGRAVGDAAAGSPCPPACLLLSSTLPESLPLS